MLIPPKGAAKLASRLVPPEKGTSLNQLRLSMSGENILIGILCLKHTFASSATSSVDFGYATATGNWSILIEDHSE